MREIQVGRMPKYETERECVQDIDIHFDLLQVRKRENAFIREIQVGRMPTYETERECLQDKHIDRGSKGEMQEEFSYF